MFVMGKGRGWTSCVHNVVLNMHMQGFILWYDIDVIVLGELSIYMQGEHLAVL